jgi:AraC-like DNA-binding protein
MNIDVHIPTESLRPFVLTYLIVESQIELVNKVLPDTSLVMAFRYKGEASYEANDTKTHLPSSSISGLRKSLRVFNYSKDTGIILVMFREAAAASFVKEPLHKLFEKSVTLDNFISHQKVSIIEEQLSESKSNTQRIHLIEKFLLSQLYNPEPDKLILHAIQKIQSAKGIIKMRDLAASLYISQDAFEKRFRRVVGSSPKQFSSIIRMKYITTSEQQKPNLAETAFAAGFFDQAHFSKDFKLFTGQTPSDFFKFPSSLKLNDFLQMIKF